MAYDYEKSERLLASSNPYEIAQKGGGVVVRNKMTGKVHGHFSSRKEAMKQFRLLEAIDHGWKPTRNK